MQLYLASVQGSIWYGSDCQDSLGNIGSEDCIELVGRFCFAPGDTLDWPEYMDQSIANDVCNACWVSFPVWNSYDDYPYSDSLLSPGNCDAFDHCHADPPGLDKLWDWFSLMEKIPRSLKLIIITCHRI